MDCTTISELLEDTAVFFEDTAVFVEDTAASFSVVIVVDSATSVILCLF